MQQPKEQVKLYNLVFTHNWEDPESDHKALNIQPHDSVLAITSGGCNVLGFLLFDPDVIYSIDINPAQSYLLELKIAAIKGLSFEDFQTFSGLVHCNDRLLLFRKIEPHLSKQALDFWYANQQILKRGFIMSGKYERFIRLAGKFINFLQGSKRVAGLYNATTAEEQAIYFDKVWNTRRFHLLFKLLFNKRMLAKRGLVADYFHFDDGSKSFAESFYNRSKKAFRDIPIKDNYFLSLYLFSKYRDENQVPAYLKRQNFEILKSRVDRIQVITGNAQSWIDTMPDESIDCFALSNICELMSENETARLFEAVYKTATKNGSVIFRNLMIPREVPEALQNVIVKNHQLSKELYGSDRSFVYGKVAAYSIFK
ncbi:MAG: BtaA family protein [Chitinophagaceae bacterium]|nr:BtaA family protein [Chitinophagaceae bacterium]